VIKFPNRTQNLLEQNSAYHGFVLSCMNNLNAWLSENNTVFFPEYTDHGLTHFNEVLLTADSIISDDSWEYMTAQDTASMIISVLLHDCAMHLTEDGFYSLIQDKFPKINSRFTGIEQSWSDVWRDYFSEAKRFDAKKLYSVFGDETPVKDIPKNKIDLSGRDRLLIGEFIRRNHARIAHEIAFYGVPGVDGTSIKLGEEPENNFLDLCGFIARSHNMGLREAVDKLEKNKKQVHLNTHVPFIMLVLRVSDYIQIHAERAPKQLLNLKTLVSPISRGEWKKHHSIIEINQAHEDPEAIYIDAEPTDALTYEELKKLFSDIQSELDLSWSVLGEVYGRYEHLKELGITIRRIRSSLDYLDVFLSEKKPTYIPKVLAFKTADAEMMELLIAPLYGDKPEVGIRELLQNSVDACSELEDTKIKKGIPFEDTQPFNVCVALHDFGDDGGKLVVEDYGIGMTLEVIENYFLNIGASFRNSDRWKKEHETDGHSNVYRTGRFGIGLLAAYLLGEELVVETRHFSEKESQALTFECKKGSDKIIVTHSNFHIGTKITVNINNQVKNQLLKDLRAWDWFSMDSPKVVRKTIQDGKEQILEQSRLVPSSDTNIDNTDWHRITVPRYDDITWTYTEIGKRMRYYNKNVSLLCNGIIITDDLHLEDFGISKKMNLIAVETPTLNVFDQDGRLPINLERTTLISNRIPFETELAEDISDQITKKMIGFCKSICPVKIDKSTLNEILTLSIPGIRENRYGNDNMSKLLIANNSLVPMDYGLISSMKFDKIYIDAANLGKNRGAWTSNTFLKMCDNYLLVDNVPDTKGGRTHFIRTNFELNEPYYMGKRFGISVLPIIGRRVLIKHSDVQDIVGQGYVPKTFWNRLNNEWENENWVLMSIGSVPAIDFDVEKISSELTSSESFGVVFLYLDWQDVSDQEEVSPFSKAWLANNNQCPFVKDA
jgi:molecular chaperone HtpG